VADPARSLPQLAKMACGSRVMLLPTAVVIVATDGISNYAKTTTTTFLIIDRC
jgi:hypothetical protein